MRDQINDFDYGKLLNVRVELEPVTTYQFYELCRENNSQMNSIGSALTMVSVECCMCLEDINDVPYIKCLECENVETLLCIKCFKLGATSGEHRRGHNYQLIDKIGPKVFECENEQTNGWGCFEDLALLSSFMNTQLDQWSELGKDFNPERSMEDALDRIDRFFLRSQIGDYVLNLMKKIPLKLANDNSAVSAESKIRPLTRRKNASHTNTPKSKSNRQMNNLNNVNSDLASCRSPISVKTEEVDVSNALERRSLLETGKLMRNQRFLPHSPISNKKVSLSSPHKLISPSGSSSSGNNYSALLGGTTSATTTRRKFSETSESTSNVVLNGRRRYSKSKNNALHHQQPISPTTPTTPNTSHHFTRQSSRQSLLLKSVEQQDDSDSGSSNMAEPTVFDSISPLSPSKHRPSGVGKPRGKAGKYLPAHVSNSIIYSENNEDERTMDDEQTGSFSRRNSFEFRANRRELLESAKNEASEALRGRMSGRVRKSSLELSEALNISEDIANRKRHKSSGIMSEERLMELRDKYPDSYFYLNRPNRMSRDAINKYDAEDLQLIGYMPYRDDFEHEYKNEAEQLISRIAFRAASEEKSEVEKFLDAVRFARIQRYNRILKTRVAKRGAIVEHDLLNEYLQIAKNNISEKGKYNVFSEKHFNSKRKEEEYKPIFCQIRQVSDRPTIEMLAKNIGKMETIMDQIDELKQLQKSGVKKLKGKLKVDTLPPSWSKKRRNRKIDNVEIRKANLRWKRIIRWSKKQSSDTEEQ